MKIIFESDFDKIKFHNWLKEIQTYASEINVVIHNPHLYKNDYNVVLNTNSNNLWYRVFDISESMYKVIDREKDSS